MKSLQFAVCVALLLAVWMDAGWGYSRTITVSVDGTEEHTTIQSAIMAAGVGDTILLGPGRYTDSFEWEYNNGAWTTDVHAAVTVDSLVIKGVDRDQVIIGPELANFANFGPKGIAIEPSVAACWIEDVTFENLFGGVYTAASGGVTNCKTIGCEYGVSTWSEFGLIISDCRFLTGRSGVAAYSLSSYVEIYNCFFDVWDAAVISIASVGGVLESCEIVGGTISVLLQVGADMLIRNCSITGASRAHIDLVNAHAQFENSRIGSSEWGIFARGLSSISGFGNIIEACEFATMRIARSVRMDFHGNHIFTGTSGQCILVFQSGDPQNENMHMENNYWGTTDLDSIAGFIYDGVDDPALDAIVDYEPIADGPVPIEKKSLGSFKAMFR